MNQPKLVLATAVAAVCGLFLLSPAQAGRTADVDYSGWAITDNARTALDRLCNTIDPDTGQPQITGRARVTMGCPTP